MSSKGALFHMVERSKLKLVSHVSLKCTSQHYDEAMERVMRRHVAVGRTQEEAKTRADGNDRPNGELVWGNRDAADVLVPSYDWNPNEAVGRSIRSHSYASTTLDINQSIGQNQIRAREFRFVSVFLFFWQRYPQ